MKWLKFAFSILGFTFQYILPILFFGGVIPYTHDGKQAGLTSMGYIALMVVIIVFYDQIRKFVLSQPKSLVRALVLSAFPIFIWFVINMCLGWIVNTIDALVLYWDRVILFIVLGRIFYTIEETMSSKNN